MRPWESLRWRTKPLKEIYVAVVNNVRSAIQWIAGMLEHAAAKWTADAGNSRRGSVAKAMQELEPAVRERLSDYDGPRGGRDDKAMIGYEP